MDGIQPSTEELKARRRTRLLWVWGVIIIVLIFGVAATGLITIPGVSAILNTNTPRDLGIEPSPLDLATLKGKIPMEITGAPTNYSAGADAVFSGKLAVSTQVTSEEITAWLQRFEGSDPLFSDVQVKFIEGGMELSGRVHKYITAPAYALVRVGRVNDTEISLSILQAKIGIFSVPDSYRAKAETYFEDTINRVMSGIDGFSMSTWELHDGYEVFKGTLPKEARRTPRGWSGLLDL